MKRRCVYCGAWTIWPIACVAHADLPALDVYYAGWSS